jgi:ribonuclease HI
MQWNARGLLKNKDQLRNYLRHSIHSPDLICIQETFMNERKRNPIFDGYDMVRRDNPDVNKRGGLTFLIKNGLNFTIIKSKEIPNIENQCLEINTNMGPIQIFNIYIPPSAKIDCETLNSIFRNKRTIAVGDFNSHNKMWGSSLNNTNGRILEAIITENNLTVLNTGKATHIISNQSSTNSVIDLTITSPDLALNCCQFIENTSLGSDHLPVITKVNEIVTLEDSMGMHAWNLKKADWKIFKNESKFHITDNLLDEDINKTFLNLTTAISTLANSVIPTKKYMKSKNKRHKPLPFWNENCNKAIYERNRIRNKMNKSRNLDDYVEFKRQNAIAKRVIADEAKTSWETYCSELNNQSKLSSIWNMARRMEGVASATSIPTLQSEDTKAESNLQKANLLGKIYSQASSTSNYKDEFLNYLQNKDNENKTLPNQYNNDTSALNVIFTIRELQDAIDASKNNKSPGEDRIPYELIKHLHKNVRKVLLSFYNKVWTTGVIPKEWNHAIIMPILKPNKDPTAPESYRPISLTPTLCKIMEKMITNRLQWFLETNKLLTPYQTGFRKHKSTIDQILRLQDYIHKKLSNKQNVLAIFIDFERAYDMLHVPTLLEKLHKMGISGNIFDWISKFLTNRTFQVKVGIELSEKFSQENGTPQGSVISSLLFLIMINNLDPGSENVELSLFADDSAIFYASRNVKLLQDKIQKAINKINDWCDENGFKISLAKTTGIVFTKKRKLPKLRITLNNKQIKIENTVKFLGVIFDSKLKWNSHIDYIVTKCKKRMNIMRAVSGYGWGASKRALLSIYKAIIRSVLDYGDVAYSTASSSQLKKLQNIQSEALRLACGSAKGTPIIALQNECGELPLHLRRLNNSLKIGSKIISSKDHPAAEAMRDHWSNYYYASSVKSNSMFKRTEHFFSLNSQPFNSPFYQSTAPWLNKTIKVDLSLKRHINKKTDSPDIMSSLSLELINKYVEYVSVYTDGSKLEHKVSAAFCIPSMQIHNIYRIANDSSIYSAELTAITEAIKWIVENENEEANKYIIFTDSLSVATSIKENRSCSRPNLFLEFLDNINKLKHSIVLIAWIPSHIGLSGNEMADTLAKKGLEISVINSTNYLELKEIYSLIRNYVINKWQIEYNLESKGRFYKSIQPLVSTNIKFIDSPRKREVQITRLRMGHILSNTWLKHIGKSLTDLCAECQVPDTIHHILIACKKHDISKLILEKCAKKKVECTVENILSIPDIYLEVYSILMIITNGKIM